MPIPPANSIRLHVSVGSAVRKDQVIAEVDPSRPGMNFVPSPVKSPIAGTVISIPPSIGATIAQGVPVARVGRTDNLEIRTEVSERFISKMQVGLNALVRFAAYPGQTFPAKVTELSPVVDPVTRTMEVKLALVNPDPRIKSGMFAEVKIITERKEGVVKIPADAMVERFGVHYVFVTKEDGTAEMRKSTARHPDRQQAGDRRRARSRGAGGHPGPDPARGRIADPDRGAG